MKELFFIAFLYLASSAILSSDEIVTYSFPVNHEYKECKSNGAAKITVLNSSPNPFFCYQTTDYFVNATIISGKPILFVSRFTSTSYYQVLKFTGTNTSIGEYNTWKSTLDGGFCHCGVSQHQLAIYNADSDALAACLMLIFTLPCPKGNVGSYNAQYNGFNIYSVKITPYPPLCKEQTIEVSGYLPGIQYNQSMQWIQVNQLSIELSSTYYYYYNPYEFDFTIFTLNNLTIKVPPPALCKDDTEYQVCINIFGQACYASWYYDVKKVTKSSLIYLNSLISLTIILIF